MVVVRIGHAILQQRACRRAERAAIKAVTVTRRQGYRYFGVSRREIAKAVIAAAFWTDYRQSANYYLSNNSEVIDFVSGF